MAGLECPRKLWQLLWDRESAAPPDGMSELLMTMGIRFGELAHRLFPDAILIDIDIAHLDRAVEDTRAAIVDGAGVVLEAAFRHGQCRVLADVVERLDDGSWHLIEVKSSTRPKPEHVLDLAYQRWVMEQAGYAVTKVSVLHADTGGVWPDVPSLFKLADVTDEVVAATQQVPGHLERLLPLTESDAPAPDATRHFSKTCHDCPFKRTVCWRGIDGFTIYDTVNARKLDALKSMGVLYVDDIPDHLALAKTDARHVALIKARGRDIDGPAVRARLDELDYPLYFLDFETAGVAVPLLEGVHPWEPVPFQFSVHVRDTPDGELRHLEYLHCARSDPTAALAAHLARSIGAQGSIVVYHAAMEKGVLARLARQCPEHASTLTAMSARTWDLEIVFRKHYRDWRFGTKSSIKVVLPVLVPGLSYDTLDIQAGGAASLAWIKLLESADPAERDRLAGNLRDYCALDTLAMVRLLDAIAEAVGAPGIGVD